MARPKRTATDNSDPDQVRNNILDAALTEFAARGLQGARVDVIAKAAGAAKRMIYYYFQSKEELYRATLVHSFGRTSAMGSSDDLDSLPLVEALTTAIDRAFDMHVNRPNFVKLLLQENFQHGEQIRQLPQLAGQARGAVDLWRSVLDRGKAEGQVKPDIDPTRLHHTVSALSQFYISNQNSLAINFGIDTETAESIAEHRRHVKQLVLGWILRPEAYDAISSQRPRLPDDE